MKTNTYNQILDEAIRLLKEKGAQGFSYQDLSEAVGIKKASIHYHFPHKEDLLLAIISTQYLNIESYLRLGSSLNPKEKVKYLALLYRKVLEENTNYICPCGMLAAEWSTLTEKIKEALQRFFDLQRIWLGDGTNSEAIVARLQGLLLMARLKQNPLEFFDRQIELIE